MKSVSEVPFIIKLVFRGGGFDGRGFHDLPKESKKENEKRLLN